MSELTQAGISPGRIEVAPASDEPREMKQMLLLIDDRVGRTESLIERLELQLMPVLTPSPPALAEKAEKDGKGTEWTSWVFGIQDRLLTANDRLDTIMNRLEI